MMTTAPPVDITLDFVEEGPLYHLYTIQVERPELLRNISVYHCLSCDEAWLDQQKFMNHPCIKWGDER